MKGIKNESNEPLLYTLAGVSARESSAKFTAPVMCLFARLNRMLGKPIGNGKM